MEVAFSFLVGLIVGAFLYVLYEKYLMQYVIEGEAKKVEEVTHPLVQKKRKRRTKAELSTFKTNKQVVREKEIEQSPDLEKDIIKGNLDSIRKNPAETYDDQL